jgi:hypothetical protein
LNSRLVWFFIFEQLMSAAQNWGAKRGRFLIFAYGLLQDPVMKIIDILKRHEQEIKKRFHVKRIGLFGSFARGDEKDSSDVDIMVEFEEPTFGLL